MTHAFAPLLAAAALLAGAAPATAADYPSKAIKLVVPYSAGGSTDALARLVAEKLRNAWASRWWWRTSPAPASRSHHQRDQGAGRRLHAAAVHLQRAAVNPGLYGPRLPYDPLKDLAPVSLAATVPTVVVVHPQVPAKTMAELAASMKSKPGSVSYASAGNGTPSHLGMESYKKLTGLDAGARALQGRCAGAAGTDGRPGASDDGAGARSHAAGQVGQAARRGRGDDERIPPIRTCPPSMNRA